MISLVELISSWLSALSTWLDKKAEEMKAKRAKKLVSKEKLTERQAKELEALLEKLPEVTVDRRP